MNKSTLIAIVVIAVILIGTGIYFATRQSKRAQNPIQERMQTSNMPSSSPSLGARPPLPSGGRMRDIPEGSQPIFGTISNLEEGSFSIKSPMGEFKVVFTVSTLFEGGSSSELKNDVRVGGYGTKNEDGTITALQIQINPSMPDRGQFPSR